MMCACSAEELQHRGKHCKKCLRKSTHSALLADLAKIALCTFSKPSSTNSRTLPDRIPHTTNKNRTTRQHFGGQRPTIWSPDRWDRDPRQKSACFAGSALSYFEAISTCARETPERDGLPENTAEDSPRVWSASGAFRGCTCQLKAEVLSKEGELGDCFRVSGKRWSIREKR